MNLEKREVWHGRYKGLGIEVSRHGMERPNGWEPLNNGQGCWCAYIYIPEKDCARFEEIWLPDKLVKFFETSPERVTH